MLELTWEDVRKRAMRVVQEIGADTCLYPIPRGGVYAGMVVAEGTGGMIRLVQRPEDATAYIDDIIDSGETRRRFSDKPFYALVDKSREGIEDWVSFPWERLNGEQLGPEENIRRLIEFIGDDPNREGLKETPQRVLKSYDELFAGYKQSPSEVLKCFEDDTCDEMVLLRDVEFYSICEHHMQPFFGNAHIAYIPNGRVVGISKLVRLLEVFSRRLQIQERLCEQVTTALDEQLDPKGSACVLEATHFCMTSRGVQKQHSKMVTSSLTRIFRDVEARSELLSLINL